MLPDFLCHAPELQPVSEGSSYMCLVPQFFLSGALTFAAATQRIPFDHLAPVAWGAFFPQSHWLWNNQRDSSWQATTPKALHRESTETHPQAPCERSLFVLTRSLRLKGSLHVWYLEATNVLSQNGSSG